MASVRKPQLAFFVCFGTAVIGCTTILGDFDVNPNASPGVDSGGGGDGSNGCPAGQEKCNDTCVDTKTSAANCGACNHACTAPLTCGEGNCACPNKGAYCDGQCYEPTDRQHCGATCSQCTGNQVCQGNCVDPPAAAFDKPPRSATGWKDAANQALTITLKATGQPGTIYECRTGPAAKFSPTEPAWANCDGANGDTTTHQPKEDATTPEGTYRTEHRYKLGAYLSPVVGTTYYVHKSLDGVAPCPRQGVPLDGPHFTDEQYFQAATAWAIANPGQFPITAKFPDGGNKPSDAIYVGNPWIKIPFSNVTRTKGMQWGSGDAPFPDTGQDYLFNERSLRHRFAINPIRNLILVTRQYIHPKTNDCKQVIQTGNSYQPDYGPPGRGVRKLDCEAYVLNTRGNALCLTAKDGKVDAVVVDRRIPFDDNADGGRSLGATFQTYAGGSALTTTTPNTFNASMVGGFVQIPETPTGRWYEIGTYYSDKTVYLTEACQNGAATNVKVRFVQTPLSDFVIDAGFPKLHQNNHGWATGKLNGGVPKPSHRTKCETAGCNTGKPWLTFLPP